MAPYEADSTRFNHPNPFVTQPLRVPPSDVVVQRRLRRVPAILAADHTAYTEVAALVID